MSLIIRNIPPTGFIREEFMRLYREEDFTTGKNKTVEICGLQFLADEPSFFGLPDLDYIEREKKWYLLQSLNVKDIPKPIPKIWTDVADEDGEVNSNYGYLVFGVENHGQFQFAMSQLKRDPNTRRAVIQFNRPEMVYDYHKNGRSDYVCTYAYQFFLRGGQLDMLVYMRSMDAIYGYPNDRAWADYVFDRMLYGLNKPVERYKKGHMVWHCGSGHIYDRHFYLLDYYDLTNKWEVDKKEVKRYVEQRREARLGRVLPKAPADDQEQGQLP